MAPLKLPRHEKFAQEVARSPKTGKSITQCYEESGYTSKGNASEVSASRLLSSPKVKDRVDEIMRPAVRKARVSVESLLIELETTIADARGAKQHGVVVNALASSAKLVGLLRDRIEIGSPGEFTRGDTIEAMITELGDGDAAVALAAIDEIMAAVRVDLEARASARAVIVDPTPSPSNEAALGLAALRPVPKGARRHPL
jgi:hypothetical protein